MAENGSNRSPQQKKVGQYLLAEGLIDEKILSEALGKQVYSKKRLLQTLLEMGAVNDMQIASALADRFNIPFIDLQETEIPPDVLALVPREMARSHLILPIRREGKRLKVTMADPTALNVIDDLQFVTRLAIEIAVSPKSQILSALEKYHPRSSTDKTPGPEIVDDETVEVLQQYPISEEQEDIKDLQKLLRLTQRPPVIRFVNSLLSDAIKLRASDIHIEPRKSAVFIRYRVDGVMREIMKTDHAFYAPLVSRIKVISNLDISVRRKTQDGKTQARYGDKMFDLRVSTLPTSYGEKVTIRILNPDTAKVRLADIGLSENEREKFEIVISKPQGIVLVTGPTGSGKSSTLYAALNLINSPEVNIITVEDPIEYDIEGINQVQTNPKAGITFAAGLRSILRQDPDIVMVGEIRDSETARIAVQAAQTGQLVLSTLHTNDAPTAITRLLDLGIDAFLISATLEAVVGQRLVRKICPHCKTVDIPGEQIRKRLPRYLFEKGKPQFWKGTGCEACHFTGYLGRTGIFEILQVTPAVRKLITTRTSLARLREAAESEGFRYLSSDALDKALAGITSLEEVFRVAPPSLDIKGIIEPETRPVPVPEKEAPPISGVEKILVVDDSPVTLKLLRGVLEAGDYTVLSAASGVEAFRSALRDKPDLIITDYVMPEMDGIELIKKLKAQLETRYIPIIMLTVKDELETELKGIDAGADDYLIKPVNAKRLLARIKRLLSRSFPEDLHASE